MTVNGTFLIRIDLAERVAVAEEVARHRVADERHLARALDLLLAEQAARRPRPTPAR